MRALLVSFVFVVDVCFLVPLFLYRLLSPPTYYPGISIIRSDGDFLHLRVHNVWTIDSVRSDV